MFTKILLKYTQREVFLCSPFIQFVSLLCYIYSGYFFCLLIHSKVENVHLYMVGPSKTNMMRPFLKIWLGSLSFLLFSLLNSNRWIVSLIYTVKKALSIFFVLSDHYFKPMPSLKKKYALHISINYINMIKWN